MTVISPINNNTANLSAVKIRINNPVTNVPEEMKGKVNEGQYNAVDIEVNRPEVNVNKKPIYEYPQYNQIVTYDMLVLPEKTSVPEPNVVTKDEQNNVSFKANPEVEIVPAKEIKPEIDLNIVISNLKNSNFDIQALEMENITKTSTLEPEKAKNFITEDVFASLIDIVNKDTSELDGPSEKQIEVRKKIIINKIIEEQTKTNNPNVKPEEIELPYQISKEDLRLVRRKRL